MDRHKFLKLPRYDEEVYFLQTLRVDHAMGGAMFDKLHEILMVEIEEAKKRSEDEKVTSLELFLQQIVEAVRSYGELEEDFLLNRVIWTKELTLHMLRKRYNSGQPVNSGSMQHGGKVLRRILEKGKRFFGSWDDCLEAAGIPPEDIRISKKGQKVTRNVLL
ncbi:hypothetical protein P9G84_31450 [Brevibacillus centrosporus]|uniref:hypothetical protein n=1 Tax=Brevibacillus centrosporus TaxID=54910 RepID=UPI001142F159|nr:hypothetical protein [Brevibacillus centrosporus]MEC2133374.1 hypothetical protein [Brevibacillus centrosporus]GED34960.1 hypothetical protein BCE02nite_61010 [Brevibacillus centrosporus]